MNWHASSSRFFRGGSLLLGLLMGLLLPRSSRGADVIINEILAANQSIAPLTNYPDYFPDYVEFYNTTANAINLGDGTWSLSVKRTPNPADPTDYFVFPPGPGSVIPAQSYLLVFFDDKTNFPGIHTTFSATVNGTTRQETFTLKGSGDEVQLYRSKTTLIDSVIFGMQIPDYSIGRFPDFSPNLTLLRPSPQGHVFVGDQYPPTNTPAFYVPAPTSSNAFTIKINEWLATNSAGADKDWFELYNPQTNIVQLTGLVFVDKTSNLLNPSRSRPIPALSYIGPLGFVQLFASDNNDTNAPANEVAFSISSSSGDDIFMYANDKNTVLDTVHSSLISSNNNGMFKNISEGRVPDGGETIIQLPKLTPEASNFGDILNVVINEVLTHTDPPLEDAIELYNPTGSPVDISNYWLSNNRENPQKFRIPNGTMLPAHGYKVFYEYEFNPDFTGEAPSFTLNSANGDEVWLFTGNAAGKLTGYRLGVSFGASQNGVSFGRYITSDDRAELVAMRSLSFGASATTIQQFRSGAGAANPGPRVGPIVINEIHYHPPDIRTSDATNDNSADEFVEILSIANGTTPLFDPSVYTADRHYSANETADGSTLEAGQVYADGRTNTYRVRGGIDFDFPTGVTLGAGRFLLLVNFDPNDPVMVNDFTNRFKIPGVPSKTKLYGPYRGKLSNGGAAIELLRPDPPQGPQHPDFRLVPYPLIERVKYSDKAPWPVGAALDPNNADGGGASLQRKSAYEFGNDPINWRAKYPPTPGDYNTPDPTRPVVSITSPTASVLTNTSLFFSGKASDNLGVDSVWYSVNGGEFLPAAGSVNWSVWSNAVPAELGPGTNRIRAYAVDQVGNFSLTNERSYFVSLRLPLTIANPGGGTVSGATDQQLLEYGRTFTLRAMPSPGYLFSNWVVSTDQGTIGMSSSPNLTQVLGSNMTVTANFVPNPFLGTVGKFNGLFWETNQAGQIQHGSSGFFSFTLTDRGTYTAALLHDGRKLKASGSLDLNGRATNLIARAGTNSLTVAWQLAFDGSDQIHGSASAGGWSSELLGDRAVFNATHPYPNPGKYTFAIRSQADPETAPAGHSYGTLTVDANGLIKMSGFLADKGKAKQSVPISKDGHWPLYVPVLKGSLLSWITFDDDGFHGLLNWHRLANPTAVYYKDGWNEEMTVTGSRYVAPAAGTNILPLSNGQVHLAGGNLPHDFINQFILGPANKVSNVGPDKLTLTFTPASGLFKGTFTPTNVTKAISFAGAVLQNATNGYGFFLGTNQSGSVSLEAAP